ncbi:MAG TPA: hypothetical protein VHO02_04805 [Fibrobacteria bacterium]|nr:hypothetical protein [Fibrobacteria bacterium]
MKLPGLFACLTLSMALLGCAGKRVGEKTPPQELGPSVGYVAFRYERANGEEAELLVRRVATGENYHFSLDRTPNSMYFGVGGLKLYEKKFGDTTEPSLVVLPLPAGEYECRFLTLKVDQPAWRAMFMPPARDTRSMGKRALSVAADTVTYIGTYRTRAEARFFGGIAYKADLADDGDERAAAGLTLPFRKRLLSLE